MTTARFQAADSSATPDVVVNLASFARLVRAEEGEIHASPMANMRPPAVPETQLPVLREDELRRLLGTCKGTEFDDRRDLAVLRLLIDIGMRRAELAGLRVQDIGFEQDVAPVVGKGRRVGAIVAVLVLDQRTTKDGSVVCNGRRQV